MSDLEELPDLNFDSPNDLEAMQKIRDILNDFYPEVRIAILEYCLMVAKKDLEA